MGSGTLQKTIVGEHSPSLHLQVQVKTTCKAKATHQQHPETPPPSLSSFEMDRHKVEKCAVVG